MDCFGTYSNTCPNLNVNTFFGKFFFSGSWMLQYWKYHRQYHPWLSEPLDNYQMLVFQLEIDSCWKQCNKMIPSSLSSRHPMLLTYCKAWQWRFVHRNDNVAQITAKTLQKQMWWKKTCTLPTFPLGSAKKSSFYYNESFVFCFYTSENFARFWVVLTRWNALVVVVKQWFL